MDSREPREDHELAAENRHLIVKRGLYFRPNDHGYTGLKREAGRYPASHADAGSGETAIHEDEAPEYSPACWEETILADKDRQIAELQVALRRPSPVAESGEYVVDPQPEIAGAPISKIVSYNQAHEEAVEMGYPSLTEALEHLSELRSPVAESTPTDATAVEAEREACAKECDRLAAQPCNGDYELAAAICAFEEAAAAIRGRITKES